MYMNRKKREIKAYSIILDIIIINLYHLSRLKHAPSSHIRSTAFVLRIRILNLITQNTESLKANKTKYPSVDSWPGIQMRVA